MGRGRSFLILLILGLGLGGYIYFIESQSEPAGDTSIKKKDKVFASANSATIEEIEVKAASGETTTLKKNNGAWEITAPEAAPADSGEVGGMLSTIEGLEVQSVVSENPASAAEYGLDPVRFSVAFKPAGAAQMRLQLGKKTPTGGDLYARVEGQPRVFLISGYLEDSLNKTPFGLRDKTILKVERDGADSLSIERKGSPALAFAKKGTDWRLSKPYDAKAEFNSVDSLVGKIAQARMTGVVAADGTKELAKYGLDKPEATAIIGAGSSRATLVIGGKKDDGGLYARDLSRPMVFTVDASLLDDLKKTPDDFRKKELFEFRSFSAVGIEATIGGKTYVFDKPAAPAPGATPSPSPSTTPSPAPAADVWRLTKPAAKDVDQTKMTDLLTTMSNLRAEKFADKAITGDEITFVAKFGDAAAPQTERITFRKSGSTVHAILPGDAGAAVVPATEYEKALALLKELAGIK